MLPNWMRLIIALCILPFVFLTEYFLVAKWLGYIHVSYWWLVYTLLADTGNGLLVKGMVTGQLASKPFAKQAALKAAVESLKEV